ncbi:MAG TPA: DUF4126 domain-containing protein [Microthrixaceae bacterium]|nr:DUF4126 domain-containing protein [Microthrixaceae bacterium]
MTELIGALGGLGLASSAGLNAYIPALLTALLARYTDLVTLPKEFEFLSSGWVLITLTVLLVIEEVVDKVPGADHLNDVVQTVVRPVSGAVLFAAGSEDAFGRHTWLALGVGFVAALGVHATKAAGRGVVNVSTGGIGAPVVSVIEDIVSLTGAVVAIVAPVLVILFVIAFVWLLVVILRKRRERRERKAAAAVPT